VTSSNAPIGIFDSGIGGLTVAHAIHQALPDEDIIYFGDTAHLPYGDKSPDLIRYYSLRITKFLLDKECKIVVIACNTASTAAYDVLCDFFKGRGLFVNVVDPLVEAVCAGGHQQAGLIATKGTVSTGVYEKKFREQCPEVQLHSLATPLLAPMIEESFVNNKISRSVIHTYLENPVLQNIDALVLACTHYPLIRKEIEEYYGNKTAVYDSTGIVASTVKQLLSENGLLNTRHKAEHHFYVSDFTQSFEETTRLFYQEAIHLEKSDMW
jgi:glutamate racemase